jgi:hypothetical protein
VAIPQVLASVVGLRGQVDGAGGELLPGAAAAGEREVGGGGTSAERVVLHRHPFLAVAPVRCRHRQALRAATDLLFLGPVYRPHLRRLRESNAVVADWGGRVLRAVGTTGFRSGIYVLCIRSRVLV